MDYTSDDHVGKSSEESNYDDQEELLKAQAHIWNHTFSFIKSMSLKCAIELGLPDIIHNHGSPMTLSQLMDALKLDTSKTPYLYRLLRMLIHSGFFVSTNVAKKVDDHDQKEEVDYNLTPTSKLLLKDHPMSINPFILLELHPFLTSPWQNLGDWFRTNNDINTFVTTHGTEISDMQGVDPMFNQCFNDAMASDSSLVSTLIIRNYKQVFEGLNSLVDVGGGNGTFAKAIAKSFPEMKCTVLDLPHVVHGLKGTVNLDFVKGSMFEIIPPANAVLLKWIMHNCSDKECFEILKKCKEAIPSKEMRGKVIIIEMVLGDNNNDYSATQIQLYLDMLMLAVVRGRQRTEKEWEKLFREAGFGGYKIIPILGLRSIIEVYY